MISTRSMGFDIGVRLGLRLRPPGYAECPVELEPIHWGSPLGGSAHRLLPHQAPVSAEAK